MELTEPAAVRSIARIKSGYVDEVSGRESRSRRTTRRSLIWATICSASCGRRNDSFFRAGLRSAGDSSRSGLSPYLKSACHW